MGEFEKVENTDSNIWQLIGSNMVKCTEEEDDHVEPVQTTKISDFFSPKSAGIVNGKKPSSSLKTTKADKKRKKADIDESKVVTNGSEEVEDEKGHNSPPAKK